MVKNMKKSILRLLCPALLLSLCLAGCTPAAPDTETNADTEPVSTAEPATTETPEVVLTVDASYHITVPADADDITRGAAELLAATILAKTGMELPVSTAADGSATPAISLGIEATDGERAYTVAMTADGLDIRASDSTTLYFAAEAILEAWLTPDFGLSEEGVLTLSESRVADLTGLKTRLTNSLKLLTQNVRAYNDGDGNTIPNRSVRFGQLLEEYLPDIFGVQEYTKGWDIWLQRYLEEANEKGTLPEYTFLGCSREGWEKNGESSHVIYRADRFELVETNTFWLSELPDIPTKIASSLDKRICTWALLKDLQTEQTILVANTHLDHSTDAVRGAQLEILLNILWEQVGDYPVYLMGDFNCVVDSEPYAKATALLRDTHKTAWLDLSTENRTFHNYQNFGGSEIDFIFHNEYTTPVSYQILSKGYDGYVSDHFGVLAEFVYG